MSGWGVTNAGLCMAVSDNAARRNKTDSHRCTTVSSRVSHNNAHRYPKDLVRLSVKRRIEKVVCSLLERSQHENTISHLGDAKACDTKNFSLKHDESESFLVVKLQ